MVIVTTVILGLDSASWNVIDPLLEKDSLANIEHLIENGCRGVLTSTTPPLTPVAWTSMATGVNPGKHGIFGFRTMNPHTYEVKSIDYTEMKRPALWDIYNEYGLQVGIINFPVAHPPRQVDDLFVSGFPVPDGAQLAYPKALNERLKSTDFHVQPKAYPEAGVSDYFEEVVDITDAQCELTKDILQNRDLDIVMSIFMGIDWIQHYFWDKEYDGENAVEQFYKYIDTIVGEILEELTKEDTVLLVSDHGARRIESEIHLNSLLESEGYLNTIEQSWLEKQKDVIMNSIWRLGQTFPVSIRKKMKQFLPNSSLEGVRAAANSGQSHLSDTIAWDETQAFTYDSMGRIFIHDSQRYADGIVDNYDEARSELIKKLSEIEHPNSGECLFDQVTPTEDIYSGPYVEYAPDILFSPKDWKYMIYGDLDDNWIHGPEKRVADHDPNGIFVCSGPSVKTTTDPDVHITDILPLLLYLHKLPLLDDLDGSVPSDIFTEEHEQETINVSQITRTRTGSTSSPASSVEDQLQDLGYY